MIAFNDEQNETTWQSNFVAMLPEIEQKLRLAFCRLDLEAREDAIEEGVVHSVLTYVRLHEQGRDEVTTPSSFAWYAAKHVKRGHPAGGRMNGTDPLSRYAQIGHGIDIERQAVLALQAKSIKKKIDLQFNFGDPENIVHGVNTNLYDAC